MTKYIAIISCKDCTGIDKQGCFDGGTTTLGPFDTKEEAEDKAIKFIDGCGPWEYKIIEEI